MKASKPESTEGPKSERRLARSLGYPPTWHLVRTVPHPADDPSSLIVISGRSFQDRIFAGDPRKHADCYFNHNAAMEAALDWVEGESTPYDNEGGQLLPRVPKFAKEDKVEVWFEDSWYPASILRVKQCPDDIKCVSSDWFPCCCFSFHFITSFCFGTRSRPFPSCVLYQSHASTY
mmetsp:Transcript_57473/g.171463  ORF Transcript_57473/g.171463 Transcript_57473/m.171463 type:complete len:176 (-) Transcript_57473:1088-1615(-)